MNVDKRAENVQKFGQEVHFDGKLTNTGIEKKIGILEALFFIQVAKNLIDRISESKSWQ